MGSSSTGEQNIDYNNEYSMTVLAHLIHVYIHDYSTNTMEHQLG
jgi:hypothetical protein